MRTQSHYMYPEIPAAKTARNIDMSRNICQSVNSPETIWSGGSIGDTDFVTGVTKPVQLLWGRCKPVQPGAIHSGVSSGQPGVMGMILGQCMTTSTPSSTLSTLSTRSSSSSHRQEAVSGSDSGRRYLSASTLAAWAPPPADPADDWSRSRESREAMRPLKG